MPDPAKTLYYCVHIAARTARHDHTGSLKWSRAFDTFAEADHFSRALIASGDATLAMVARFHGGRREVLESTIRPSSSQKIIRHYLDIEDALLAHEEREKGRGPTP